MSYLLPHLHSGYAVDQAILAEEDRVVIIRFGHDYEPNCMQMDEILASVSDQIKNFAVIYLVDISEVPDFNTMYELYDPCTTMFFFRCGWTGEGWLLCPPARAADEGHHSVRTSLLGFSTFPTSSLVPVCRPGPEAGP